MFAAITYSTPDDVAAMEYARAAFLLFERSRRSAFASLGGTCVRSDGPPVATVALPPHTGLVLCRP